MTRPSSIDQMPEEFRSLIGQLRGQGWTIDQIREHLATLLDQVPSRSALGRHIHGMDKIAAQMRRSRQVAEALVRDLGDAPESRTARLNIELLHGTIMELFIRAAEEEDGSDKDAKAALAGNPMGTMMLAKALDHLSSASKRNIEFVALAERRATEKARREAATAVDAVGKEKGLTADTVSAIKARIFGVKTP